MVLERNLAYHGRCTGNLQQVQVLFAWETPIPVIATEYFQAHWLENTGVEITWTKMECGR